VTLQEIIGENDLLERTRNSQRLRVYNQSSIKVCAALRGRETYKRNRGTMIKALITVAIACAGFAAPVQADPVHIMHAGEWESQIDKMPGKRICLNKDRAFDSDTLAKMTQQLGIKCSVNDVVTSGSSLSYTSICEIAGGRVTQHGVITFEGDDSFSSRTKAHYEGGPIKIPDIEMSQTSHRLGACQPGDHQSPF